MFDYEEACPISKAASVLCERWTLQIIREMLMGARHFSEFTQLLPKMSPSLLTSRLKSLEDQGIIVRKKIPEKKGYQYLLTPSGLALKPVLTELGKWGIQWVFERMDPDQLNISAIVRDYAVALNTEQLPGGECTIQVNVTGENEPVKKFILVRDGSTQVCEDNIGCDVDVYITADLATLGRVWYGEMSILSACKKDNLKVVGPPFYVQNVSKWLGTSQFAAYRNSPENVSAINPATT